MEIPKEERIQIIAYQKIASIPRNNTCFSLTHGVLNRTPLKQVKKIISELQVIIKFVLFSTIYFLIFFLRNVINLDIGKHWNSKMSLFCCMNITELLLKFKVLLP